MTPSGESASRLDKAAVWLNEHVCTELGPPQYFLEQLGVDVDALEFSQYASSVVEQSRRGRPQHSQLVPLDAFLLGFGLGIAFERTPG